MSVSKRAIFLVWYEEHDDTKKFSAVESYVFDIIDKSKYNEDQCIEISNRVKNFTSKISMKWRQSHRARMIFERNNKVWLDSETLLIDPTPSTGRSKISFTDSQEKTKKKKVSDNAKEIPCDELMSAASTCLYKAGKRNASVVVSMLNSDDNLQKRLKSAILTDNNEIIKYTAEEALALYIDGGYTKRVYMDLQNGTKKKKANIFPTYDVLLAAKKLCYPDELQVTDHSFEVPLQCLIDHTVARIFAAHSQDFKNSETNNTLKITAIYKWGCDGSSGHPTYRQNFDNVDACMIDQHMFTVCLVPLQIVFGSTILWKNAKPTSTRYCRPLKLLCQKESAELIHNEVSNIKSQIANIQPTKLQNYEVHHQFHMTMIDGKVFSVVAETSSQKCGICDASPKKMNNLQIMKDMPCKEKLYECGLSTLHAWIRFFECILHIAYRIPIEKWQIRSCDKVIVDKNKTEIQTNLRKGMGILVDIPMPGSSTTNNGNTARRFFQQPNLAAQITGVSSLLKYRFSVILLNGFCSPFL